ncbi:MAG TPA: ATP-binding cassette domain-containing protein [Thermoleophilaceae bacterium]
MTVAVGEVFGFLGPNGAGKSTTVKMLTTLLTITSGRARVAGVDVAADPDAVRRRIGVALQEAGLDPRQTGRELLVLQARLFGLSPGDAATRTEELLALVELEDAADRSIKGYSGGMKRRLDLASALVHEPAVLFRATLGSLAPSSAGAKRTPRPLRRSARPPCGRAGPTAAARALPPGWVISVPHSETKVTHPPARAAGSRGEPYGPRAPVVARPLHSRLSGNAARSAGRPPGLGDPAQCGSTPAHATVVPDLPS